MDASPPEIRPLFLDTMVQIDRVIGPQVRRDTIRRETRDRRLSTSGHVLGEYKKTLVKDAAVFQDLIRSSESVSEALKRLPSYFPKGRKLGRTVSLLASLGLDGDKQNTLDRLQDFIEWRALDHSWESVDESYSTDEVGCVLRSWEPQKNQSGTYEPDGLKCLKASPPPCAVQQFIDSYRSELETFASAAANHKSSNITSAAKAFISILSGDDVPLGERSNCYRNLTP